MADAMWEEVDLGRYAFNRAQEQAALLTRITLEDVMELFESATDAVRSRKLVVGVLGRGHKMPTHIPGAVPPRPRATAPPHRPVPRLCDNAHAITLLWRAGSRRRSNQERRCVPRRAAHLGPQASL